MNKNRGFLTKKIVFFKFFPKNDNIKQLVGVTVLKNGKIYTVLMKESPKVGETLLNCSLCLPEEFRHRKNGVNFLNVEDLLLLRPCETGNLTLGDLPSLCLPSGDILSPISEKESFCLS